MAAYTERARYHARMLREHAESVERAVADPRLWRRQKASDEAVLEDLRCMAEHARLLRESSASAELQRRTARDAWRIEAGDAMALPLYAPQSFGEEAEQADCGGPRA